MFHNVTKAVYLLKITHFMQFPINIYWWHGSSKIHQSPMIGYSQTTIRNKHSMRNMVSYSCLYMARFGDKMKWVSSPCWELIWVYADELGWWWETPPSGVCWRKPERSEWNLIPKACLTPSRSINTGPNFVSRNNSDFSNCCKISIFSKCIGH